MKWLTPFAWLDDAGGLHLVCERALEAVGLPITDHNLQIAAQALAEQAQRLWPDIPLVKDRKLVEKGA
jgi:hypothetical protein